MGANSLKLNLSILDKYFPLAVRLDKLHYAEMRQAKKGGGVRVYAQGQTPYHKL